MYDLPEFCIQSSWQYQLTITSFKFFILNYFDQFSKLIYKSDMKCIKYFAGKSRVVGETS